MSSSIATEHPLLPPQERTVTEVIGLLESGKNVVLQSPTGSGKCLSIGTPVLMFDGSVVPVESVVTGDRLMGPDSNPRTVLSTTTGEDEMFEVIPKKGSPYTVNSAHILTLRMNSNVGRHVKGDFVDIEVRDYLRQSKTFRWCAKGYRCGVREFGGVKRQTVSPYVVGLWLGDGHRKTPNVFSLSCEDLPSVLHDIEQEAATYCAGVSMSKERGECYRVSIVTERGKANPFLDAMRSLGLGQNKFVPFDYKTGSIEVRLDVLAGLIDTDGHLCGGCWDYISKDKQLSDDVVFLCRSLGIAAYMSECKKRAGQDSEYATYFRVSISGNIDMVPCRTRKRAMPRKINKDARSVGITVRAVGTGEYAGFELDGDGRFLLGDFTVTHNTRMAAELMKWSEPRGGGIFYVNRKSLVSQTSKSFLNSGLIHGVRAAEHEETFDPDMAIQIASADTERVRVYGDKAYWNRHECGLVVVDEAHIQKGDTMQKIIADHVRCGAKVVLMSATPIALARVLPDAELVVAGTLAEFRDCGLLVAAVVKSIEQPDVSKVKRSPTGEFVIDGKAKKVYTQSIVANVIDRWKKYNPDARPTMLYAPGKPESTWMCKQFNDAGIPWCHVDATEAYYDGKRYTLNRNLWEEILEKYRTGEFKGISSRFKLREGVDVPSTYHIILATPIGSLASYLQTVGRGLRAAPDKDHCLITDHGGCYWRHGSPNRDRDWRMLWRLSEAIASSSHQSDIRNGDAAEPIRCPACEGERLGGIKCPHCGHTHTKSQRHIIMEDGLVTTVDGALVPPKKTIMKHDTQKKWDRMYFGLKRKKSMKTFAQLEGWFAHEHGYWPPRTLLNQPKADPKCKGLWHYPICEVRISNLRTTHDPDA